MQKKKTSKFGIISILSTLLLMVCFCFSTPAQTNKKTSPLETRCGWLINPTPANVWFRDRDGEWLIGTQGGYQIKEDWPWPDFKKGEWVETNVHYGYGCACFKMKVDRKTRQVLEIKTAKVRPLSACEKDKDLKKWKP